MNVSTNSVIKDLYTKKLSRDEVKEIKKEITQNLKEIALHVNQEHSSVDETVEKIVSNFQEFQDFLQSVGYDGKKSLANLSKEDGERILKEMFEKADYKKLDIKI
jgi:predicted regulator of amino acid metabolism with ACT domain